MVSDVQFPHDGREGDSANTEDEKGQIHQQYTKTEYIYATVPICSGEDRDPDDNFT